MSLITFLKTKYRSKKNIILKVFFFGLIILSLLFGLSSFFGEGISEEFQAKARVNAVLEYELESQIFFNDLDGVEVFSENIRSTINDAQKSIYIAMYSFNDKNLISLLEEKHAQGIEVVVLIPKSKKYIEKGVFKEALYSVIEIGPENDYDIANPVIASFMHHKFIITDPYLDSGKVLFGSTNLTDYQQSFDSNFYLLSSDTTFKKVFLDEFRLLEKNKYGVSKIRTSKFKPFALDGQWSDSFFEMWFGPGYKKNSFKTRILQSIESAERSIDIIGWRINDRDIFKALRQKAKEGLSITIILDDYYMWDDLSVSSNRNNWHENMTIISDSYNDILLKNNTIKNSDTLPETFNSFLHHHSMMIDDEILIAGSNNWSNRGFHFNDESAFVTNNKYLLERYRDEFRYLLDKYYGIKNIFSIDKDNKLIFEEGISTDDIFVSIYVEQSYPQWLGSVCQEISPGNDYVIQSHCLTNTTRIFIHDDDFNLISSQYAPLRDSL